MQTGWVGEQRWTNHRAWIPSIRSSSSRNRTSVAILFAWLQALLLNILLFSKQALFIIKSSGDPRSYESVSLPIVAVGISKRGLLACKCDSDQKSRISGQRVTVTGTFPTALLRTWHAPFRCTTLSRDQRLFSLVSCGALPSGWLCQPQTTTVTP